MRTVALIFVAALVLGVIGFALLSMSSGLHQKEDDVYRRASGGRLRRWLPVQEAAAIHWPYAWASVAAYQDADDPKRRCIAFQQSLDLVHSRSSSASKSHSASGFWTRRRFVGVGAVAACAVAGGVRWKWDEINDRFHPLPSKRFVALLNWPASDARIKPMLQGVIDAIANELVRAEAFDRDLLVIPPRESGTPTSAMGMGTA